LAIQLNPRIYKGTRDFLPEQMIKRNYVLNIFKKIFEKYGFEPLETPTLELWETLSGKYGEEGDQLTYRFIDRGKREVGLRYDLTVPLSRVVAMYPQIPKPFKRYQIQPVWRADKPQKGRYREFYQCDVDIVGSPSILADGEIITVLYECLNELKFTKFFIRFNSRKILKGVSQISGAGEEKEAEMCRAIDKFDKIGFAGVKEELMDRGISVMGTEKILDILSLSGTNEEIINQVKKILVKNQIGLEGLTEMEQLLNYLKAYDIPEEFLKFDLTLARGLDYYTGPIYETQVKEPQIGSITGGGRYDGLIGLFSGQKQPATGSSLGFERILAVMEELDMFPFYLKSATQVLVTVFNEESLPYSIRIAQVIRKAGIPADLYTGQKSLRGQFGLANDKSIPIVLIAGSDEIQNEKVSIKNMLSGIQETVLLSQLITTVLNMLEEIKKK
jgi:histidyl-tRNA synthetase